MPRYSYYKPGFKADSYFIAKTCSYLTYALAIAAIAAWSAIYFSMPMINPILYLIVSIGLLIGMHVNRKDTTNGLMWLLAFAGFMGLFLGPMLGLIATSIVNGPMLIATSLILTALVTAGLTLYGIYSQRDFSVFGGFLSMALFGLIGVGLLNAFLGFSPLILMHACFGVVIFSLFLLYDISMVKNGRFDSPITAACALFLDIVNLFVDILQIMLYMNSDSKDTQSHAFGLAMKWLVPLAIVVVSIVTIGLLEGWVTGKLGNGSTSSGSDDGSGGGRPSKPYSHDSVGYSGGGRPAHGADAGLVY